LVARTTHSALVFFPRSSPQKRGRARSSARGVVGATLQNPWQKVLAAPTRLERREKMSRLINTLYLFGIIALLSAGLA
jgi:hypothetical protein